MSDTDRSAPSSNALATTSAWLSRLSPVPWMIGAAFFFSSHDRSEAIAAACLAACFVSLTMAVVGGWGFFRIHNATKAMPPKSAVILGAIGIVGGMVTAMASVLIADLAASARTESGAAPAAAPKADERTASNLTRPPTEIFGRCACFVRATDASAPSHIAIGEPAHKLLSLPGRVWVFSGTTFERLCVLTSRFGSSSFGCECEDAGDQNGDGASDVAVSVPDTDGEPSAPRVEIVSLVDGSCVRMLASEAGETNFGTTVVNVGDVDGDGNDDLLVRTFLTPTDGREQARFILFSGKSGARLFSIDGTKGNTSRYGRRACRLPDLDGDNVGDFAVTFENEVRVYSGKKHTMLFHCVSTVDAEDFGHAICAVGDVDGDGIRDFAIGCPFRRYQPGLGGSIRICSGKTGDELSVIRVDERGGLGYSMDTVRDFDGDGVEDILTSQYHWLSARWMVLSSKTGARLLPSGPRIGPYPEDVGWRIAVDRSSCAERRFLASSFSLDKWGNDQGAYLYSGNDGKELHSWTLASVRALISK